jgi:O-antigen ligase
VVSSAAILALAIYALSALVGRSHAGVGVFGSKWVAAPFGFFDMNTLGGMCAIGAAVLTGLATGERRISTRIGLIACAVCLTFAVVVSRSRGAWLGAGVALVYVVVRSRSRWLTVGLAAAAVLFLSSGLIRETVSTRVAQTSVADASLAGRAMLWNCAARTARANWLVGVGFENFRVVKTSYGFPRLGKKEVMRYNAHSLYFEVLADLGVLGLAVLVGLLSSVVWRLDRLARESSCECSALAIALASGLLAFAVHGVWDCLTMLIMLPAMLLGLAVAVLRLRCERRVTPTLTA